MDQPDYYHFKFLGSKIETGSIRTLRFQSLSDFSFEAGQWIHLSAVDKPQDKAMVRHMSIASAPSDDWLEFTMDLGSGSAYKTSLAELEPGDEVVAFKLKGEFTVDPERKNPVVFIAGGLGITPIRSNIRELVHRHSAVQWALIHVARNGFLFEEELRKFPFPQWRTNRANLDNSWSQAFGQFSPKADFYICGSERFLDGMRTRLNTQKIPESRIFIENFK